MARYEPRRNRHDFLVKAGPLTHLGVAQQKQDAPAVRRGVNLAEAEKSRTPHDAIMRHQDVPVEALKFV